MAAHQALPSLGFSRQENWSGLPFPSPVHESEKWKWSRSVVSYSSRPHGLQPTRVLHPWDFPGKSTWVGCHCLPPQHSTAQILIKRNSYSLAGVWWFLRFDLNCIFKIREWTFSHEFSSVQSLSHVRLFATPWTAACQTFLSITNSRNLLKLMSIQSVMPSNHLILFCPLLFLSSLFPSIRVFSNESVLPIRWPPCKMLCIMRPGRDHLWIVSSYNGLWAIRLCSNWLDLQCHLWHTGYMLLP